MRIRRTAVIGAIALSGLLVACSADETDFKEAAEKAIRDALKEQDEDAEADCEDPENTDVGTTFACTGTASGTTLSFTAEITGKKTVTVNGGDPVADTGTEEEPTEETEG